MTKPMPSLRISVITPTIRPEGLQLVRRALSQQTFRNCEWLIGSPFEPKEMDNPPCPTVWVKDDFKGGLWSLNRIYNRLVSRANGQLLVSWQDFTWGRPDTLERFWYCYELEPKTLVSGVGNKYEDETWVVKTWQDPRERDDQGSFYPCDFADIEWNFCAVPKEALYAIGGFDEGADFEYLGMDGYGVNERLWDLGGWDFKLNQRIKSFSLGHGRVKDWEKLNGIHGKYIERRERLKTLGQWPKMAYLDNPKP